LFDKSNKQERIESVWTLVRLQIFRSLQRAPTQII
jgi:hypothetical protein